MELNILSTGKEYISAVSAAKKTGYSSDYIGQLCRSGKVAGKLVDRVWYVDLEGLENHKKNRQLGKPKKVNETEVFEKELESLPEPVFQKDLRDSNLSYETEDLPLLPQLNKNIVLIKPVSDFAIAKQASALTLGFLLVFGTLFATLEKISPKTALEIGEEIASFKHTSTQTVSDALVSASFSEGATASVFSAISSSMEFVADSFVYLRNLALGGFSEQEVDAGVPTTRTTFTQAIPSSPQGVAVQAVSKPSTTISSSSTSLKSELEAYVRAKIAELANPTIINSPVFNFNTTSLREEILLADTRPTVTRQADADSNRLSLAAFNIINDGTLYRTRLIDPNITGSNISGLSSVFINATSTNASSTNLFAENATFTNILGGDLTLTNILFTSATGTSATTTNLFSTTSSSTNLFSTNFNLGSGLIGNLNFGDAIGINSTTTNATSTNLFATNATFSNLIGSNIDFSNLLFTSATGTSATTTNFFSTIGTFDELYVNDYQQNDGTFAIISTVATGDIFSVTDANITNGTLIHQTLTANAGNGQVSKGQVIDLTDSTVAGGGYSALEINISGSGVGSGEKTLLSLNPGGNNEVVFDADGAFRPTTDASQNTNSIGSSSYYWKNGYFDTLTANNLSGTVVTGSTSNDTWTIGSTEAGDSLKSIIFQRNSGSGNATFEWNGGAGDRRYLSVNYPFNSTYTVDDSSIGTNVNLYSGALTNNTTSGTQRLLSITNTGTGTTEHGIYLNNTGTGTTAFEIAGTWTNGIVTNNNSINAGSGNITTTGLGTLGNLLLTGSSTLQNLTFVNATGTSATTTNFFSTTSSSTNLFSTNFNLGIGSIGFLNFSDILGVNGTTTNATSTNFFSTTASSTNLSSTNANIGTATIGNLLLTSSTTLQNLTFVNATGTSATTTNFFSTTASSTNIFGTNANLGNLSFGLATGTSATTTNFFSTTASSTNLFSTNFNLGSGSIGSLDASSITNSSLSSGRIPFATTNGLLIDSASLTWDNTLSRLTASNIFSTNSTSTNATSTNFFSTTASSTNLYASTASINGNAFNVDGSGNVGIGTTNPLYRLSVTGGPNSAQLWVGTDASFGYLMGRNTTTGDLEIKGSQGLYTGYNFMDPSNNSRFYIAADSVNSNTGFVGLGTRVPTSKIHAIQGGNVNNKITLDIFASTQSLSSGLLFRRSSQHVNETSLNVTQNGDTLGSLEFQGVNSLSNAYATSSAIRITQDGSAGSTYVPGRISFFTSDGSNDIAERLTIKASGNVGIGTTNPSTTLDVLGTASSTNLFTINSTSTNATSTNFFSTTASSTNLFSSIASIGGSALNVVSSGNVGIGTTNPGNRLDVFGTQSSLDENIITWARNDGAVKGTLAYDGNDNSVNIGAFSDHALDLVTNNISRLTVDTSGNVGIGTTNPGSRLTIDGGHLTFGTDNTYDIGASGATRPRTGYFGTSIVAPTVNATSAIQLNGTSINTAGTLSNVAYLNQSNTFTAKQTVTGSLAGLNVLQLENTSATGYGPYISAGTSGGSYYSMYVADRLGTLQFYAQNAGIYAPSVRGTTEVTTPLINTASGDLDITPASGSNLDINLATTGDLRVNTDQLYVDTSAGNVGIGITNPADKLDIRDGLVALSDADVDHGITTDLGSTTTYGRLRPASGTSGGLFVQGASDSTGTNGLILAGYGQSGLTAPAVVIAGLKKSGTSGVATSGTDPVLRISNDGSASLMEVLGNGKIGIGSTSPYANVTNLHIEGAKDSANKGMLGVFDNTAQATGVGGRIILGGNYIDANTSKVLFAGIEGVKENSTSNNYAGALVLSTTPNGGNLTERLRINSSGNVGVGTSTPQYPLDVNGDFRVGESGSSNALFVNTTLAKVGIGKSVSDTGRRLEISGLTGGQNYGIGFFNTSSQIRGTISLNEQASDDLQIAGAAGISLFTGSTIGDTATAPTNQRMTINSSGNVGIGTTNPSYLFDLQTTGINTNGSLSRIFRNNAATNLVDPMLLIEHAGSGDPSMAFRLTGGQVYAIGIDNSDGDKFKISTHATANIGVGNGDLLTITTSGAVGIGTTNPGSRLTIDGGHLTFGTDNTYDIGASGATRPRTGYFGTSLVTPSVTNAGTLALSATGANPITFSTNGSQRMEITSGGLFGIGRSNAGITVAEVNANLGVFDSSAPASYLYINSNQYGVWRATGTETWTGSVQNIPWYVITNNTERMRVTAGGNVGIGTTNPGEKLEVAGSINATGAANSWNATGPILSVESSVPTITAGSAGGNNRNLDIRATAAGVPNSGQLFLQYDGKVGIGTTNPVSTLDVSSATPIIISSQTNSTVTSGTLLGAWGAYSNDGSTTSSGGVGGIRVYAAGNYDTGNTHSYMSFYTHDFVANNGTALGNVSERMRIDSSGNVGIGITNPGSKLVSSSSFSTTYAAGTASTWASNLTLANTSTPATGVSNLINFQGASNVNSFFGSVQNASGYGDFVWGGYAGSFIESMRLTASGSVGIGTTNPGAYLDVYGGGIRVNSSGTVTSGFANGVNMGTWDALGYNSAGTKVVLGGYRASQFQEVGLYTNASERLTIDSSGNVGIGTTGPSTKFHIYHNSNSYTPTGIFGQSISQGAAVIQGNEPQLIFSSAMTSAGTPDSSEQMSAGLGFNYISSSNFSQFRIGTDSAHDLEFRTSNTARMTILSGGNVGIGVTNPTNKLHVVSSEDSATTAYLVNTSSDPYGMAMVWTVGAPDNNSNYFLYGADSVTARFAVYSDGDVVNHDNSYGAISDVRLKENISSAGNYLDLLNQVQIKKYSFISDHQSEADQVGVIAQELELIFPELVNTGADGYKTVAYSQFTPLMIRSIQELSAKVELLENASSTPEDSNFNLASIFDDLWQMIVSKMATAANSIGDFFANRVRTKELCVSDDNGETCITKAALDSLLANAGIGGSSVNAPENNGGGNLEDNGGGENVEEGGGGEVVEDNSGVEENGGEVIEESPEEGGEEVVEEGSGEVSVEEGA